MSTPTTVAVRPEQARTYHLLEELLGPGITRSLDEFRPGSDETGTWRLTFGGIWVYIYVDGTTEADVLTDYCGFTDDDLSPFVQEANGYIRAP